MNREAFLPALERTVVSMCLTGTVAGESEELPGFAMVEVALEGELEGSGA